MQTILVIAQHSPDMCPANNEKAKKITIESLEKLKEKAKKHGVKVVGVWAVFEKHWGITVFEAPNFESFEKLMMEPEALSYAAINTSEIMVASNFDEIMKTLKQLK